MGNKEKGVILVTPFPLKERIFLMKLLLYTGISSSIDWNGGLFQGKKHFRNGILIPKVERFIFSEDFLTADWK